MQPDDQQSYQQPPVDTERGPVVTLSPDEEYSAPLVSQAEDEDLPLGAPTDEPIHWQASEYIHREKDHIWFIMFILVTIGLMALAVFVIKAPTFAVLIPVMAATVLTYARRPPRILDYTLSRHGLHINDQLFSFNEFKSFALIHGLEQYSIMLVPVRRFKPAITINFPEEVGEGIVDMLAARLPMREVQPDIVDRIIRKLHL